MKSNELRNADKLTEALCVLASEICELRTQKKHEFEWHKSHHGLVTKQDLKEMEKRIMGKIDEFAAALATAATKLSTTADALSVSSDILTVRIDAVLAALADVQLPAAATAALASMVAATDKVVAAGDAVDANVAKLDGVLNTPAPGIPGTPVITQDPVSQDVVAGTTTTLSVVATGESLAYQWKKNSEVIPGATSASLVIESATAEDAGTYTVTVSNNAGSVVSKDYILTVS